ncbi:hypothetical protein [Dactylosporangium sp. CA-139066]
MRSFPWMWGVLAGFAVVGPFALVSTGRLRAVARRCLEVAG